MADNELFGNSEQLDTISRQAAIDKFEPWLKVDGYSEGELNMLKAVLYELRVMPSAQPEIIRCKDCKHRPTGENRDDLEFPDEICPCQCEDFWYSWKPADDWYCGNGKRKDGNGNGL